MDKDDEEKLKKERFRQFNRLARDHIWSEEDWNLLQGHLSLSDKRDILSRDDLQQFLQTNRQEMKITAPWGPKQPQEDTIIRRYRTFESLETILQSEEFWFSTVEAFDDRFEGMFPQPNIDYLAKLNQQQQEIFGQEAAKEMHKAEREAREDFINFVNKKVYINCWREGESESAVFWNAYIGGDLGVAIETTVGQFKKSIEKDVSDNLLESILKSDNAKVDAFLNRDNPDSDAVQNYEAAVQDMKAEHEKMQVGSVEYIDFQNEAMPQSQYARFFHKRDEFSSEREFRAVFEDPMTGTGSIEQTKEGQAVRFDPNELINRVILSPNPPDGYKEIVEDLLDYHEIEAPVVYSDLDRSYPDYGRTLFMGRRWSGISIDPADI
ncbi:hypothetical protein [Halococcus sp. IIIV-5B]|uniref:hypothetical protein n=1 Tax=Halococcus sp. IIIV-5B TaxID=2321230 RepID=UPI000E71B51D|nr:hypothetical protein [Halococcus sp. IIIV-5B]RJT03892.1 hypothetical protein D3261_10660 [Halococcus sp. IIIV-5B]